MSLFSAFKDGMDTLPNNMLTSTRTKRSINGNVGIGSSFFLDIVQVYIKRVLHF